MGHWGYVELEYMSGEFYTMKCVSMFLGDLGRAWDRSCSVYDNTFPAEYQKREYTANLNCFRRIKWWILETNI